MEIIRPRRAEYRRPSSIDGDRHFRNVNRFIDSYTQRVATDLSLLNHVGILTFSSHQSDIDEREAGLAEYLLHDPPPPSRWIWGRTLVGEIVSQQLFHATLSRQLEPLSMYVDLVPTSVDASSPHGKAPYQKGVDLCLVQMQLYGGSTALYPVCGIDVTLGNADTVRCKRQRPGLQSAIAMPAIVVPMTHFMYNGKASRGFARYLDDIARTEILEKGTYTPFYGLDDRDVTIWQGTIRSEIQHGLNKCRERLDNPEGYDNLAGYQYLDEVMDKIELTRQIAGGAPTRQS